MRTSVHKQAANRQPLLAYIDLLPARRLILGGIHVLFLFVILQLDGLDYSAKASLFAFLSAMTLWIGTTIPAGLTAAGLLVFLVLIKAANADLLYQSMAEKVVWLMIGSFMIGEAVKQSGLSGRFSMAIMERARKKTQVLAGSTLVLFISAFFIPSTSGRAALSMPIMKQLGSNFSAREKRTLAVLVPVVILMSTSATLIGAGAHLIGVGLLEKTSGESISFLQWMIWGAPFALVITAVSFVIITRLIWPADSQEKSGTDGREKRRKQPFNAREKKTLIFITALMGGWMTEGLHGYDTALITIAGGILFMLPRLGVISWKAGIEAVSWNLILFVAAATALGQALVDSGVVEWMESGLFGGLSSLVHPPEWLIVLIILGVTVTSHLYITSHTTRAVVFIPSLLVLCQTVGANPAAAVFLSLIGMNYCITFPVSSKALLLFYEDGDISYDAKQLIKLSAVLMPLYIILMMVFYYTFWKWTGLDLNMG